LRVGGGCEKRKRVEGKIALDMETDEKRKVNKQ